MKSYFFNYGNEFIHKIKTDLHISKTNMFSKEKMWIRHKPGAWK